MKLYIGKLPLQTVSELKLRAHAKRTVDFLTLSSFPDFES